MTFSIPTFLQMNIFVIFFNFMQLTCSNNLKIYGLNFFPNRLMMSYKSIPSDISRGDLDYSDFQIIVRNFGMNNLEAKEIFHLIDLNDDNLIQKIEWTNFYELFAVAFEKCDTDKNLRLSLEEGKKCLSDGEKFKNMLSFNQKWVSDTTKFQKKIFNSFDLDMDGNLTLFDYVSLRNYNNAYDLLLVKDGEINFRNFGVAIQITTKSKKIYEYDDFIRIFNRTLKYAYFPSDKYMDFATFSQIGHFFKLFVNNNYHTLGYLSYTDLMRVGQYTLTYKLLQNFTQLFVKNDLVYENLSRAYKMSSLIYLNENKIYQRNLKYLKDNTRKISVEQIYLLYREFETLYDMNITFPFTVSSEKFENLLKEDLHKNFSSLIDSSFKDYQTVAQKANKNAEKQDFMNTIFNIVDLNNSTFLEIYELLLVNKVCDLFTALQKEGKIINNSNDTSNITNIGKNFSDNNILILDIRDVDYLIYINYKFNKNKINFHQFLFIFLNRLRDTSQLIVPIDINNYLNYFGFYISDDFKTKFYEEYQLKDDEFLSYALAIQKYFEFYSDNL